ncbi:hypothetical protein ADUPG1_014484, partial [Aduncisulcus paluster]
MLRKKLRDTMTHGLSARLSRNDSQIEPKKS